MASEILLTFIAQGDTHVIIALAKGFDQRSIVGNTPRCLKAFVQKGDPLALAEVKRRLESEMHDVQCAALKAYMHLAEPADVIGVVSQFCKIDSTALKLSALDLTGNWVQTTSLSEEDMCAASHWLRQQDADVAIAAVKAFEKMAVADNDAWLGALAVGLEHPQGEVRSATVRALGKQGKANEKTIVLVRSLAGNAAEVLTVKVAATVFLANVLVGEPRMKSLCPSPCVRQ